MEGMNSIEFTISRNIQLGNALFNLLIVYFVYRHYRDRNYAPAQRYRTTLPRFFAGIVDQAVLFPIHFLLSLAAPWLSLYLLALLQIIIDTTYSILLHARYGQTVGKRVCRIRIVDHLTGTQISLNQALLRDSGLLIGLFYAVAVLKGEDFDPNHLTGTAALVAGIWFMLEIITMLLNEKRRALHDLIASTVVIRTQIDAGQPAPPSAAVAPQPPEDTP